MPQPSPLMSVALAVAMLAAGALVYGGTVLIRRGETPKGALMLVAAGVAVVNVLIWTV